MIQLTKVIQFIVKKPNGYILTDERLMTYLWISDNPQISDVRKW